MYVCIIEELLSLCTFNYTFNIAAMAYWKNSIKIEMFKRAREKCYIIIFSFCCCYFGAPSAKPCACMYTYISLSTSSFYSLPAPTLRFYSWNWAEIRIRARTLKSHSFEYNKRCGKVDKTMQKNVIFALGYFHQNWREPITKASSPCHICMNTSE